MSTAIKRRMRASIGASSRRARWLGAGVAISPALAAGVGGPAASTAEDLFTPADAARSLASADPTAVGVDAGQQAPDAPVVTAQAGGFEVKNASVEATIPTDADDAILVETPSGNLEIEQQGVSVSASTGEAVNDNAAVVYANTGHDSDTSIVPVENGVETFTNIRSEDAAEEFSIKVDLPGDEKVEALSDGTVAIFDPTPEKPSGALPEPAVAGSPRADAARKALGVAIQDPDRRLAEEATAAVERAGTTKPIGVATDEITRDPSPAESGADFKALSDRAKHEEGAEPSQPPTADDVAVAERETEQYAETIAKAELANTGQRSAEATELMNEGNVETAESAPALVATVDAPQSIDADGKKVDTALSVDGDVITMHVDHRGENVTYPIAADPLVNVVVTRWRVAYYPVLKQETYLDRWALGQKHVGSWHPVYCPWGWVTSCQSAGPPWYYGYASGVRHTAYWPTYDWGPVWQDYYYPVYATRWVVSSWVPYWEPYSTVLTVEQSASVLSGYDVGGYAVSDGHDGESDAEAGGPVFIAASAGGGRMRDCTRVFRNYKLELWGLPDLGHIKWTTKFCWNKWTKRAQYASESMEMSPALRAGWEFAGYRVDPKQRHADRYEWNGGAFGQVRMWQNFDLMICTPVIKVACATEERGEIVHRGRWDGSHYGVMRQRR